MKILFVISNLYVKGNGMSVSARRTIKELRLAGQEVRVLSGANPEPNGPEPEYKLELFKIPIFQPIIDHNGFCFARSYTKKDLQVMEEAIRWADVVHVEEFFPLHHRVVLIAKRLGKPITATYHIHPENILYQIGIHNRHISKLMLKYWKQRVYKYCDWIQCPTENVYDRLMRYHINANFKVISNGVIPEACTRPLTPPENYLDENRPLNVLYIGRFSVEKDQPTLLEAMRYSRFNKRIQLHFAGQGPRAKALKRMADRLMKEGVLKYEPVFQFHTHEELRNLAAHADLAIHCATIEVEGLSIMEAMQQAVVPVIAVGRHTGTPQFALDRRSKFPKQNPEALAKRIDYWLSHPQERWEMGFKYAESMKQYDIKESAKQLIEMFEEAVRGKR
ncbi:MAG: glycosyltransferase [Paludibacteraceae bacterium]|nr:glycosyltransferase [Paludibacteraceae bacterium]